MKTFEYHCPSSLEEASSLLKQFGPRARLLAGGTDLLVRYREGTLGVEHLISFKNISGLERIETAGDGRIRIGALCKVSALEDSAQIREQAPDLAEAASLLGSRQIKNLATVGGNLCNAAPSAELALPLIAARTRAIIYSPSGERSVPVEEFFTGPGATCLREGEILKELEVAALEPGEKRVYLKHSLRQAMDIALVNAGISLRGEPEKKNIASCVIALGAVAPIPIRARKAEAILLDGPISSEALRKAAEAAAGEARPISDVRSSAEYRREMVRVLVRRGLERALAADKTVLGVKC